MIPPEEQSNYETFRDCLSDVIIRKLAIKPSKPPRRRTAKGRKNAIKPANPVLPEEEQSASDAEDLGEFIDYLASEIFAALPAELRLLTYTAVQNDAALRDRYTDPLPTATLDTLASSLPPSVPDSLVSYALLPDATSLPTFLAAPLSAYIASATAPPPIWSATRASACELCERDWIPLTYHHLIPRSTHERVLKRGWHDESRLNSVAWLCRACHSFVHGIASNEELAREWYTVERLRGREDVQRNGMNCPVSENFPVFHSFGKPRGGKHFSRNLAPIGADGEATSMWAEPRDPKAEESSEEDEDEDESSEEEESGDDGPQAGQTQTRQQRKEAAKARKEAAIKKQKQQATAPGDLPPSDSDDEDSDDDDDELPANPNLSASSRAQTSASASAAPKPPAKNTPVSQLSRREREALQAQQAKERYQKLHAEGKTEEARADLERLRLVRERREAEAARKKAEAEEKAELEKSKAEQIAREQRMREAARGGGAVGRGRGKKK